MEKGPVAVSSYIDNQDNVVKIGQVFLGLSWLQAPPSSDVAIRGGGRSLQTPYAVGE
jgi:hypothetical protein